jgi:hypothetical protein
MIWMQVLSDDRVANRVLTEHLIDFITDFLGCLVLAAEEQTDAEFNVVCRWRVIFAEFSQWFIDEIESLLQIIGLKPDNKHNVLFRFADYSVYQYAL